MQSTEYEQVVDNRKTCPDGVRPEEDGKRRKEGRRKHRLGQTKKRVQLKGWVQMRMRRRKQYRPWVAKEEGVAQGEGGWEDEREDEPDDECEGGGEDESEINEGHEKDRLCEGQERDCELDSECEIEREGVSGMHEEGEKHGLS